LYPGIFGRVIPGGDANRLRGNASTSGQQIGRVDPGEIFQVIDGPVCGNDLAWVQVRYEGTTGWTAESSLDGYWLEPLPGDAARDPNVCTVTVLGDTNKRGGPGTNFEVVGQLRAQELADVIGRAVGPSGLTWYQLADESWMREDVVIERGLCDAEPLIE
jgi:hypothetical protein